MHFNNDNNKKTTNNIRNTFSKKKNMILVEDFSVTPDNGTPSPSPVYSYHSKTNTETLNKKHYNNETVISNITLDETIINRATSNSIYSKYSQYLFSFIEYIQTIYCVP